MAQKILYVLGAVLLVVGILGFFMDPVLGIFEVDAVHNLVHLVTGAALLVAAYLGAQAAMSTAKVLGVVYALVAVAGFVLPGESILGIIQSNLADDVLHAALAVVLLYAGFMRTGEEASASGSPAPAA